MGILKVDGIVLRRMITAGANLLNQNRNAVDDLNVFPVPDGDTGTNMSLTALAAAREAEKISTPRVCDVAKAASGGSLRGARGNSGVILSQLFRGFAKGLEGKELAGAGDFAEAFVKAAETAYKAVMKPKEGTILTVAREVAERMMESAYDTEDVEELFRDVIAYGNTVLKQTTEMLPELKQAGVVDAGGQGLLLLLEGALVGMSATEDIILADVSAERKDAPSAAGQASGDIAFGYCTEFFVLLPEGQDPEKTEAGLKTYLPTVGDSIVVVSDENLIKIHVHSNHPGTILEKALKSGSLSNIKIENMRLQHTSMIQFSEQMPVPGAAPAAAVPEPAETDLPAESDQQNLVGFVAVAAGAGLSKLFDNLGVDQIIEGGQTMNPSTEDILAAVEAVPAEHVIVLPNNKNIVLAAQQAAELCTTKTVHVLPTTSVPQGLSAMVNYSPLQGVEENLETLANVLQLVRTGQVTYAVRDTVIDDKTIAQGDILCMLDGEIEVVSQELQQGARSLIDIMALDGAELFSIYYGEDASEQSAQALATYMREVYPDVEVEVYDGGQPLYYYLFSAE